MTGVGNLPGGSRLLTAGSRVKGTDSREDEHAAILTDDCDWSIALASAAADPLGQLMELLWWILLVGLVIVNSLSTTVAPVSIIRQPANTFDDVRSSRLLRLLGRA